MILCFVLQPCADGVTENLPLLAGAPASADCDYPPPHTGTPSSKCETGLCTGITSHSLCWRAKLYFQLKRQSVSRVHIWKRLTRAYVFLLLEAQTNLPLKHFYRVSVASVVVAGIAVRSLPCAIRSADVTLCKNLLLLSAEDQDRSKNDC